MARRKRLSRIDEALLETVQDLRGGIVKEATARKITMRILGEDVPPKPERLRPEEIRILRDRAGMSQAVFARHLNVTTGYVSQLERGAKSATGAALALLQVIRRKGIEAIL